MSYISMVAKKVTDPHCPQGTPLGFRNATPASTASDTCSDPTIALTPNALFDPADATMFRNALWMATPEQFQEYLTAVRVPEESRKAILEEGLDGYRSVDDAVRLNRRQRMWHQAHHR